MSTPVAEKMQVLRRDIRDLEQVVEHLQELAKHKLTTEEASARYNTEATQNEELLTEKRKLLESLINSQQLPLFQ